MCIVSNVRFRTAFLIEVSEITDEFACVFLVCGKQCKVNLDSNASLVISKKKRCNFLFQNVSQ